jgi:hypothetical protein
LIAIFLLPLAFLSIWIAVGNLQPEIGWRQAAIRAALLWGGYLILLSEALSLVSGISFWPLLLGWSLPPVLSASWLWRRRKAGQPIAWPTFSRPTDWGEMILAGGVLFYLGVTALTAWLSPPNTFDSLNYHMSRVVHWAQDRAIHHYASGVEFQNTHAPGAEIAILNADVLSGSDRFANFVQWFAMLGSLMAAGGIAKMLDAGRRGQWLAAVFAVTIPVGIAEASSTMTDYVTAFWLMCTLSEIMFFWREKSLVSLPLIGMAAGLAFLTKPIAAAYLLPMGVLLIVLSLRDLGLRNSWKWGGITLAIALSVNAGYLLRNQITFSSPIETEMAGAFANERMDWRAITSNVVRNAALHVQTPWPELNEWVELQVLKVHIKLGVELNDPATTRDGYFHLMKPSYSEVLIGNPFQAVAIVVVSLFSLLAVRRVGWRPVVLAGLAASGFVIFSALFKWQIFGSRYHLPFFVLFAPIVGVLFDRFVPRLRFDVVVGVFFLVSCWSWLFFIEQRPLAVNLQNDPNAGRTLLNTERWEWYFATTGFNGATYQHLAGLITEAGCREVGLNLRGNSAEYLIWVALNAPRSGIHLAWRVGGTPSARYEDPTLIPCAIICDSCGNQAEYNQLPKTFDDGSTQLFVKPLQP